MVGDDLNDTPAIASATFGIALGAKGTDAALEVADVMLRADDLTPLPLLLHRARHALRIVKANIFFALAVKAGLLVAALGHATFGATPLVMFNGLWLLRARARDKALF